MPRIWTHKYLISVALITGCLVATGVVLWQQDTPLLRPEPVTGTGEYWRGDPTGVVTIDVYADFG